MSIPVFRVDRRWSGDSSSTQSDDGQTGASVSVLEYDVVSSIPTSSEVAKFAPGVPRIGFPHPERLHMRCRDVNCDTDGGPIKFIATAEFFSQSINDDNQNDNPLNEPPKIRFFSVDSEEQIDEDVNGNPITTVNGEPIEGLTIPITDLVVNIKRNLPSFNPAAISAYKNKVNSMSFLGYPKGTARIIDITANNEFADDFEYWVVEAQIQFRLPYRNQQETEKAWWKRVLHQGFYVRSSPDIGAKIVHAVDEFGELVTKQVLLKENGLKEDDKDHAHWLEFQVYGETDFNQINLL